MSAKYSAITAKLKAMRGASLNEADFAALTEKKTVRDICLYLKDTAAYGEAFKTIDDNDVHRGQMEHLMNRKLVSDFKKIRMFMDNQHEEVIRFFFIRREIEFLKRRIHYIYTNEEKIEPLTDEEVKRYMFINGEKVNREMLGNARSLEDFAEACKGTMYEEPLKRANDFDADFFMVGMIFDEYYYRNLWKMINGLPESDAAGFKKIVGSSADMLNIMWIYRGKKYFNFSGEVIFSYLLPVKYRLREDDIRSMVNSENEEEFIAAVHNTAYSRLPDGTDDGLAMEENYVYLMNKIAESVFRSPSLAAIAAYSKIKDWEIWRITTVIEGVRYSRDPLVIRRHIRTTEERSVV